MRSVSLQQSVCNSRLFIGMSTLLVITFQTSRAGAKAKVNVNFHNAFLNFITKMSRQDVVQFCVGVQKRAKWKRPLTCIHTHSLWLHFWRSNQIYWFKITNYDMKFICGSLCIWGQVGATDRMNACIYKMDRMHSGDQTKTRQYWLSVGTCACTCVKRTATGQ